MIAVQKLTHEEILAEKDKMLGAPKASQTTPKDATKAEERPRAKWDAVNKCWLQRLVPKSSDKYVTVVSTLFNKEEVDDLGTAQDTIGALLAEAQAKLGGRNIQMYFCGDKGITQEEIKSKAKAEERTRLEHNMRLAGMSEDMIKAVLG